MSNDILHTAAADVQAAEHDREMTLQRAADAFADRHVLASVNEAVEALKATNEYADDYAESFFKDDERQAVLDWFDGADIDDIIGVLDEDEPEVPALLTFMSLAIARTLTYGQDEPSAAPDPYSDTLEDCLDFLVMSEDIAFREYVGTVRRTLADAWLDLDLCLRSFLDAQNVDTSDYAIEVYEHWIVDGYLGHRLEREGEIVAEFAGMTVWGRSTTGQAISMDWVIRKIVLSESDIATLSS